MEQLIEVPMGELLQKFGAGKHKPGSGSAAALEGMISAQMIRTVIDITIKKKGYEKWIQDLIEIKSEIESQIYPALQKLFQQDSEQFDKVFNLREARDREQNPSLKKGLKKQVDQALKPATETPIEIAKLCIKLSNFAAFVFDNGFKSARGDSGVAINSAISAIAGCLSIINLNLETFDIEELEWCQRIRPQVDELSSKYKHLSLIAASKLDILNVDADRKNALHLEINKNILRLRDEQRLPYPEIEIIARELQNALWKYRNIIWKTNTPEEPIDMLKPERALKVLGYQVTRAESLGLNEVQGDLFEIAGIIDKQERTVDISKHFSPPTQNFTLAHELGHAILHKQAVLHRDKAFDGSSVSNSRNPQELEADKFATFFLMPKKQVETVFERLFLKKRLVLDANTVFGLSGGNSSSVSDFKNECKDLRGLSTLIASRKLIDTKDNSAKSMADIFGVSIKTMAIRLEELELVEF